ncbi:hypothetical protein ACHQM5_023748 [Ranunculus cassubicifolius]
MAAISSSAEVESSFRPKMGYVKHLAESTFFTSIPSNYTYSTTSNSPEDTIDHSNHEQIPIIDFSLLTSTSPAQRSNVIQELGKACQDWGFFMVINHGVPESLLGDMIDVCKKFFDQSEQEKLQYAGKHPLDPIRCGTSFNSSVEKVFFWRDFVKILVHPQFHSPLTPSTFSEISFEYCKRTRVVARELLKGISESLGLEELYIDKAMELESCFQILIGNLYPPCPQPELAMGMPPHSDHGLLTFLIQNQISGLEINHNGKWIHINALPSSFLVNTGDQLEILSNGKYKSVLHRAVVNSQATRMSIATTHGPPLDKEVAPAPELVDNRNNPAMYQRMTYKEYLEFQQSNILDEKSCLDRIKI